MAVMLRVDVECTRVRVTYVKSDGALLKRAQLCADEASANEYALQLREFLTHSLASVAGQRLLEARSLNRELIAMADLPWRI